MKFQHSTKNQHVPLLGKPRPKLKLAGLRADEETLVTDDRATTRPAQMVEEKLLRLLDGSPVGVSSLRLSRLVAARPSS
jgi:hypothetical protein